MPAQGDPNGQSDYRLADRIHLGLLRSRKDLYESLYACGEDRVGCINCPMAGKHRKVQLARYPGYRDAYIRAYGRMIEERRSRGLPCDWQTGEDVLHWSLEDGVLPGQMVIEGMEEDTL